MAFLYSVADRLDQLQAVAGAVTRFVDELADIAEHAADGRRYEPPEVSLKRRVEALEDTLADVATAEAIIARATGAGPGGHLADRGDGLAARSTRRDRRRPVRHLRLVPFSHMEDPLD